MTITDSISEEATITAIHQRERRDKFDSGQVLILRAQWQEQR